MSFLGVGSLELLFIILIAVVVVGPKDLKKAARTTGRFLRRVRNSEAWKGLMQMLHFARELPGELIREAELEELEDVRRTASDVRSALDGDLKGIGSKLGQLDEKETSPPTTPSSQRREEQTTGTPEGTA